MENEYLIATLTAISVIVNVAALVALWGNLCAIVYNLKHFRKGGIRITYLSGAYVIKTGDLNGSILYKSSANHEDFKVYREKGKIEHYESILPFFKWNKSHWTDDIRTPQYPLSLLG